MNIGILYFSSTGNSLYIAQAVQKRFGGEIKYLPKYDGNAKEYDKIFIVTPIYSFGMPAPVFDLLPKLNKTSEIIIILNYGGMTGNAERVFYEYATKYGLNVKSIHSLKMPENYTLVMSPPSFWTKNLLKTADKRIGKILDCVQQQKYSLPKNKRTHEKTYLKNKGNWHIIGSRFSVNDKCVKCGKCVNLCPSQNITLDENKIVFGDKCIACLGCFHRCPNKAIIYLNKDNKKRYVNPNVEESQIGKDL